LTDFDRYKSSDADTVQILASLFCIVLSLSHRFTSDFVMCGPVLPAPALCPEIGSVGHPLTSWLRSHLWNRWGYPGEFWAWNRRVGNDG